MSVWFKKNLPIFIIMGIIAVLLALFLLPAYARTNYEIVQGTTEGNKNVSLINTLTEMPNYISDVGQNLKISFGEGKTYYEEAFPIFSTLWVALFIYVLIKNKSGGEYKNIEHGSGDWCKNGEQYSVLNKKEGFALAVDNYLPVIPNPPLAKNGNILVIGGSGSGKSASFAIPNVLQMLGSYICTDPKGELYDKTAGILKKYGYEIHVFLQERQNCGGIGGTGALGAGRRIRRRVYEGQDFQQSQGGQDTDCSGGSGEPASGAGDGSGCGKHGKHAKHTKYSRIEQKRKRGERNGREDDNDCRDFREKRI